MCQQTLFLILTLVELLTQQEPALITLLILNTIKDFNAFFILNWC